jgi:nucleotide-binding universal stress UspA family protein
MSIVLAVLENAVSAGPVLETAGRLGELTNAGVEAVAVPGSASFEKKARHLARQAGILLRPLGRPEGPALVTAVAQPEVLAAVVGARPTRPGHHPVGPVALNLLERTRKPVVVVRPDLTSAAELRRILIPLEGSESSSRPVLDQLATLIPKEVELVVLHVFTDETLPAMLDHPARDLELIGREFLHRHLPHAHRIELRHGSIAGSVAEVCEQQHSDLVVLSWSQDASPGRAQVVREVLASCPMPVLLLPAASP